MAITTIDGMIAALPGQLLPFLKVTGTLQTAGQWFSPWLTVGIPGPGTAPSAGVAGVAVDSSVAGGVVFTNPGSGLTYLSRVSFGTAQVGMLSLYDRLWHNSGLSPTSLTAQTVNSVTLPSRCPVASDPTGETFDTNGTGVEAWFQVYAVMGSGSTAPSISYTDEAGNSGSTGAAQGWLTAAAVGRCFPFSLAAGDRGVRSIQTYTNGATLTSGTFGLVLRRRLATIAVTAGFSVSTFDFSQLGMPVVPNSAHLELLFVPSVTTTTTLQGDLAVIQG